MEPCLARCVSQPCRRTVVLENFFYSAREYLADGIEASLERDEARTWPVWKALIEADVFEEQHDLASDQRKQHRPRQHSNLYRIVLQDELDDYKDQPESDKEKQGDREDVPDL